MNFRALIVNAEDVSYRLFIHNCPEKEEIANLIEVVRGTLKNDLSNPSLDATRVAAVRFRSYIALTSPFPFHQMTVTIVCFTCVRASKCSTLQPCNMVQNLVTITSEYENRLAACPYVPRLSYGRRMLRENGDPNRLFLAYIPTAYYYLSSSLAPRIGTTGHPRTPPNPSRNVLIYYTNLGGEIRHSFRRFRRANVINCNVLPQRSHPGYSSCFQHL